VQNVLDGLRHHIRCHAADGGRGQTSAGFSPIGQGFGGLAGTGATSSPLTKLLKIALGAADHVDKAKATVTLMTSRRHHTATQVYMERAQSYKECESVRII
jgi:hypothetical protein